MDMPLLRALVRLKLFLLILISSACLGDGCSSDLSIVTLPSNASILQGSNHTFWCKGSGSNFITDWEINGIPTYELSEDSNLKVVNANVMYYNDGCTGESMMTVHAESAPEDNTLSTFVIKCVIKKPLIAPVVAEAYLKVHVIGGADNVELISPASPKGPAIIQWKTPDVLSGSSSPLYCNITVRDPSNQTIAQNTTMDTSFAIDSDLLVPCHSYQLTLLPFQQISGHAELGIMTQTSKNYSGTPLPATDVKFSVSLERDAPSVTVTFKVNFTSCSLQWPEKYTVIAMQQGTNKSKNFQSAEQTVMGMENEYTLENLDLKKKYQVSIKLENSFSSSIAEIANFSTFNVQDLTLTEQEGGRELNVHCDMAKGAEDKNCTVMMRNETGVPPWNCFPTGARDATCNLSGLALGKYMMLGYDQDWEEIFAVERPFPFTQKLSKDLTNIAPTTRTDDTTTLESSPSRFEYEEAVRNDLIFGIVAPLVLILTVGLVSIIVAVIVMKLRIRKRKDYHPRDTEAAHTEVHVYHTAEENEYDEHNIPQQQDTGNVYDEHNPPWQQNAVTETIVMQEPAYADAQTVINTTPTTNNSRNHYMERRKEWLAYSPHTTNLIHTPDGVSL